MNIHYLDKAITENARDVDDDRAHEIAQLWQDACRALGKIELLTHHIDNREIMAQHTNFGSAAACNLAAQLIYDRIEKFIKAEI